MPDELVDLVNSPEERLHVELKSSLNLDDPKHRADLARHIAAISNFGGGYIVFGFDDQHKPCLNMNAEPKFNRDVVSAITKKYLEPSIQCDVRRVTSDLGNLHEIIVVPSHHLTPVCAKANGPDNKGKIEGIVSGTYYIRKTGPESAPILNATEWKDVIRRCVLNDRVSILAALTAALSGATADSSEKNKPQKFSLWREAANEAYLSRLGENDFPVPLKECHVQLSYMISTEEPESLNHKEFTNLLRQLCFEVDNEVNSGWSLFYIFDRDEMSPYWTNDPNAGVGETDFLETSLITQNRSFGFDFWRVSPLGLTTVIREYWEDTSETEGNPRSYLNPNWMAMTLLELVRHAEVFSSRFTTPIKVDFFCEWRGLRGRRLHIPSGFHFTLGREAKVDSMQTKGSWTVGQLANEKFDIVAELGARVARVFDWHDFSSKWISDQKRHWRG